MVTGDVNKIIIKLHCYLRYNNGAYVLPQFWYENTAGELLDGMIFLNVYNNLCNSLPQVVEMATGVHSY